MSNTPEGKVKDMIKKVLKANGAWYHMPVQNGMGKPTLDFTCCYRGLFFAIEAKAPGKLMTSRQIRTCLDIKGCGGTTFVVFDEDSMGQVVTWMATQALKGSNYEQTNSSQ